MKLWLVDATIEGCYPVWTEIDSMSDTEYAARIREDYAEELIDAGLLEAVTTALHVVYRRTELGELLLTISNKKAFTPYMELEEVLEILNKWEDIWEEFEEEEEADKEVGTLLLRFSK